MTEPTPQDVEYVRALHLQVAAGATLCAELLDRYEPGIFSQPKRERGGPTGLRYAYGQLHTTWINLGHWLIAEAGQQPWTIEPLVTRVGDETSRWEFSPEGTLTVSDDADLDVRADQTPPGAVTFAPVPTEPRYTLDEARVLLAGERQVQHTHAWSVEQDETAEPVGLICAGCHETRSLR